MSDNPAKGQEKKQQAGSEPRQLSRASTPHRGRDLMCEGDVQTPGLKGSCQLGQGDASRGCEVRADNKPRRERASQSCGSPKDRTPMAGERQRKRFLQAAISAHRGRRSWARSHKSQAS